MAKRDARRARFVYITDAREGVTDDAGRQRFGWWLVAGNNRAIGRAARASDTVDDARSSATTTRERRGALATRVGSEPDGRRWHWSTLLDGQPVAVSTHGYARRAECARALDGFLAALPDAQPIEGVVWTLGPGALRDFDRPARDDTRSTSGRRRPGVNAAGRHA